MSDSPLLAQFSDEVLRSSPCASLPVNLSDFWLTELARHLEQFFDGDEEESDNSDSPLSLPLAAVTHILFAKNGDKEISIPMEKMFEHFQDYRIELALEEVRRKTEIKSEPATLETIFTERNLYFSDSSRNS